MAKSQTIVGLDIGSSKVACVVALKDESQNVLDIVGVGTALTIGIRKGVITDIDEVTKAIDESIDQAERMSGIPIEKVFVSISGSHIESQNSRGVIAVSRADGEISTDDVIRAIEAARAISIPSNREILHVIPRNFIVDGQEGIKDPMGMSGIRLEVEAHIITGNISAMRNITKTLFQSGIDISEIVFAPLATSTILLSKQQKELGVCLLDFGAQTTDMIAYEEGEILLSSSIPLGGANVTNDIAIGLRTSIQNAENIKKEYGYAISDHVNESTQIDMKKYGDDEQRHTKQYLAEIIEARLDEILLLASKELKKIGKSGMLPAGIVITGQGSKIPGILDLIKDRLKLPVEFSSIQNIGLAGMTDKINDSTFHCALGLTFYGSQKNSGQGFAYGVGYVGNVFLQIKKWLSHFLP